MKKKVTIGLYSAAAIVVAVILVLVFLSWKAGIIPRNEHASVFCLKNIGRG